MAAYGGRSKWSLVSIFPIDTVGQLCSPLVGRVGLCFFRRCCGEGIHGWFAIRNLTHFSEPLVELRVVTIPGCWFFTCRTVQVLFRVSFLGHCTILKCDFAMDFGTESAQIE